ATHKGNIYPGEHQAIISRDLWDQAHAIFADSPRKRAMQSRSQTPALLKGLLFAPNGLAMTPTHTRKKGKLYRYYVTTSVLKLGPDTCPIRRVPSAEIEEAVVGQVRALIHTPEMIVRTMAAAQELDATMTEADVRNAITEFEPLWNELFPAEQARIIQLLVD